MCIRDRSSVVFGHCIKGHNLSSLDFNDKRDVYKRQPETLVQEMKQEIEKMDDQY